MKPTFALDLTRESIGLLHRTPKGWLPLGDVAFDAPDLPEALDYLRKTALGLSPMGIATKVVLPNSQILYTEVHAPGPSRDEKRKQIMAALEGRTPYDVTDLVIDWSGKGATVKVAVVARETLAEAEAFATEHRLNPVSFVAIPAPDGFVGEPWFGPTEASASILAKGETVDRDRDAITILHRELPVAEKPAREAAPPAAITPEPVAQEPDADDADGPLPGLEEALSADLPDVRPDVRPETPANGPAAVEAFDDDEIEADDLTPDALAAAVAGTPSIADAVVPTPDEPAPDEPAPGEPALDGAGPAATAPGAEAAATPEIEEAPFAHVTDPMAFPDPDDDLAVAPRGAGVTATSLVDDDLPPAPPSAAMVAFASRRAAAGASAAEPRSFETPARSLGKPVEDLPGIARPPAPAAVRSQSAGARSAATGKGFSGLVTAPTIPGTRKVKTKGLPLAEVPRPAGAAAAGAKTLTKPGGTFGARTPQRGKPRFLGLILTGLLLVCLALVAAWATRYSALDQPADNRALVDAGPQPDTAPTALADARPVPDVDDEMLADLQDPEDLADPLPEAAAASDGATDLATDVADPAAAALAEAALAEAALAEAAADIAAAVPEPAPATAVTTELVAAEAPTEDRDEIFLSAMDSPPPALDALSLPVPEAVADTVPDSPVPPPPFGTVYQFDARGLLKPTADGILSPEGVFLIAGKPPVLPPTRSEAAAAAAAEAVSARLAADAAAAEAAVAEATALAGAAPGAAPETAPDAVVAPVAAAEPVASDPAMAGFRPRPRPEGLAPATDDDAALNAAPTSDFAGLRPAPRPDAVLTLAAASRPAPAGSAALAPADLGAQGASLTAQRDAQLAAAAAAEAANPSVVAISRRPAGRPRDLSRAVEAAVAAAVREPAPQLVAAAAPAPAPTLKPEELDELDEPETATVAPRIPTRANVAKQATYAKAINLSKTNLIGVYGTQSKRYALIRQSNGRYKKVKVGDKIDGGTIQAITENEVRYQKGGKLIALSMPKA